MSSTKRCFLIFFVLFILLFWDGQLSFFVNHYLPVRFNVTSQLFLMVIFSIALFSESSYTFLFLIPYGFIYDSYYFKAIGIALLLFPTLFYALSRLAKILTINTVGRVILFFLFLFCFECLSFALGHLYGLTSYPLVDFLIYQLSPTLIFNILVFSFLGNLLQRLLIFLSVDRIK